MLLDFISSLGSYAFLTFAVMWVSLWRPPKLVLIRNQMYEIGAMSLAVVAVTGLSTGMVLAAQAYYQLSDKGLASATGIMVTKSMILELGPVLTAFMVTGRVGAAICAELGTMRVTEQIDALSSMAVDPVQYLIAPRFIAGLIALPLLTVFSCAMGVFGGYIVAVYYYGMSPDSFLDPLPYYIKNFDYIRGLVKAFVFGFLIITISSYRGMVTTGGAAGVGRATTNSVVICYSAILITNFIITVGLNNLDTYLHNLERLPS